MKGWIYKITHRNELTGQNDWPGYCYIGQTRQTIGVRWSEHRNGCLTYEGSRNSRKRGKHAKLYEVMAIVRVSNFVIEQLAEYESQDENELVTMLKDAEASFIEKYDSIKKGWNTQEATRAAVRNTEEQSLSQIAKQHGVACTSLRYRIRTFDETIDVAVNYLKQKKNEPTLIYNYKRQHFHIVRKIAESTIHNPNKLDTERISKRIRTRRSKQELKESYNQEKNELVVFLTDDVFTAVIKGITVKTPDGETLTGSRTELHQKLLKLYPKKVPKNLTTINSRLKKPHWTNEQSYGLDYPPDLFPVKHLIEEKGYTWADGHAPNFLTHDGTPVVLEGTKEIFPNQTQFGEAYGLPKDMVSDYLNDKKMTPEAFLKHKGLTP